jgi:hypothetical protein
MTTTNVQSVRDIIRAFLGLPPESLPSASYIDVDEAGDPWSDIREYLTDSSVAPGVEIRLHADRPDWQQVIVSLDDEQSDERITLSDYADTHEHLVLYVVGIGLPRGMHTVIGHPDLDFAERRELLDLPGFLDTEGWWNWDGTGTPTDDNGNSITVLQAFESPSRWNGIVKKYQYDEEAE